MQQIDDNYSELSKPEAVTRRREERRQKNGGDALRSAAQARDKVEFTTKSKAQRSHERQVKQRNEDFMMLMKVLAVMLIADFATREFFFQASLPHLKMIEQNRNDALNKVFMAISELSDKYAYVVIIGATYHVFDVPNAFVVTATIYTALGVLSITKSVFHEARPFFVSDITPTKCWLEYGNPSGHSITSSALYLTVWDLMCRRFQADKSQRRISLAFTLFTCFMIAFSRIYHGVHTYNQILLGWMFGISLYYFFCHVVYNDMIRFCSQTDRKTCSELFFNNGTFVFYAIYAIAIFNFLFGNLIHPAPEEWAETINRNCSKLSGQAYDDPETENFIRFNLASTIAGSYLGLIIEQRYMGTHKYKEFNKTTPFITMLRVIICTITGSPSLAGLILCPSKGIHWTTKLLFKTVIPISLGNFYLFGCSKYVALKAGLINTRMVQAGSEETATQANTDSSENMSPKQVCGIHPKIIPRERAKSE